MELVVKCKGCKFMVKWDCFPPILSEREKSERYWECPVCQTKNYIPKRPKERGGGE